MLRVLVPVAMQAGSDEHVAFRLTNRAGVDLESAFPFRTQLGFRWLSGGREIDAGGAIRTPLPRSLRPGEEMDGLMRVVAPNAPGRYVLRLSVVQEGVAWFDDIDPSNGIEREVLVYDAQDAYVAHGAEPADVFPPWAVPTEGFHVLERHGDAVFRWVGGDARIELFPSQRDVLEFDAESGPGMGSQPFSLRVERPDGGTLVSAEICGRTRVTVPLSRADGLRSLLLRAPAGGAPTAGDHRILNYRVFAPGR